MAPQKRRREGDGDVIAVERASSSLRQEGSQRKKVRLSEPKSRNGRGESVSSDSDDDQDEALPDAPDDDEQRPASTQYEQQRDGNWEHLQNEELDDQIATQRFLSRKERIGDNHAANNAIILEITCINFMCHDKLHVELGPLINFIVGMNGSGKSAVLTAITLCLGGKTASTDRGNAIKKFVKSGTDQSILIVKLKNEGMDAYQPDLFGDIIIVERHFSRSGSNGYKLRNQQGRIISNKKSDIDDIVEYFQLQVDNPMTVLTQDKAKSFLTKSTPKQKYEFFAEGVQLRTLDNDYKSVSETCDSLEIKMVGWEQSKKLLKKKAEAARAKSEIVQKHEGLRREGRRIRNQLAWAQVEEQEKKLEAKEVLVAQAQREIEERERVARDKDIAFQRTNGLWEQAQEMERNVRGEGEPLAKELETAKEAHATAIQDVSQQRLSSETIRKAMTASRLKVQSIKTEITAEEKRLEDINGGSHARKKAEVEEAKLSAVRAKAAWNERQRELPRLQEEEKRAKENAKKMDIAAKAKGRDVEDARKQLEDVNRNRGDIMAGFDKNMARLIQNIRNESEFQEKPIGPLGLHIRLLKPEWSSIIEKTVGGNLGGFVVTSKNDQLRLARMVRQAGIVQPVPILIGNNSSFNINEPDPKFDTILRVLDIDNELVKRQLIIAHGIEQAILIEDLVEANKAMYDDGRPHHVRQCLVINKNKRGWGFRLAHAGRNGQDRDLTPIQPFNGKPRMKTAIETQIQTCRSNLHHAREDLAKLELHLRQAQQEFRKAAKAISDYESAVKMLKIDYQKAEAAVEDLQSQLDREVVEEGKLDMLHDDLKEAEQSVAIDEEAYGNTALEKAKLNNISTQKKRALDTVRERVADHDEKLNKAHTKTRNTQQARDQLLREKNAAIIRIEEAKHAKESAEGKRDIMIANVENIARDATTISERVMIDRGETISNLQIRFNKIKRQLEAYAAQNGASDEIIQNEAVDTQEAYGRAESNLKDVKELVQLLKHAFQKRITMYREFQRHISARSRINFAYLLSERAFRGKLLIDHKAMALDIHVEPDETTRSGKGRQTKTLSGGEKSFANICLLLSLWEAMGQPLRCLDEFDVFMDDVNRDVSTGLIIHAARRSVGRQFILITPKGLGNGINASTKDKNPGADVKMIKLNDPREKSQRRIDHMVNGEEN